MRSFALIAALSMRFGLALGQQPGAAPPPPPPAIAKLVARAAAARDANQIDDALRLYRQALQMAPKWEEGWWQTGVLHYDRDQYPQCRDAFRRFTALNTKISSAFAFLGLCEFQTKEFGPSLAHLEKAVALGLPREEQMTDVALYHLALLHTKGGDFERALQFCTLLARKTDSPQNVVAVAGIAALRRPIFPHELPEADRDLAIRLGSALLAGGGRPAEESRRVFEELVKQYPDVPNVHYSYATVLLANDPDKGVAELKRELEINPGHLPALISLSFEYLKRDEAREAQLYAERAAKLAPGNFAARTCLGRVLLEREEPDVGGAIRELEAAAKLEPSSPQVYFSLASAYARAGRKMDADKARAEFARLKKLAAAAATQEVR